MSTVQEIAFSFSFSARRQHLFQETLKETTESQEQMGRRTKLRTLGKTGWGARADSLCTFKLSFDVILKALEVLHNLLACRRSKPSYRLYKWYGLYKWFRRVRGPAATKATKARGFINSMLKFEFIIALIACEWLLQFTVPLTNYLQRVDLNLL